MAHSFTSQLHLFLSLRPFVPPLRTIYKLLLLPTMQVLSVSGACADTHRLCGSSCTYSHWGDSVGNPKTRWERTREGFLVMVRHF